ncbi:MAG: 4Fe-4S dicluster domain-containing protein [Chloroflexota bacterium]|nr:MAG: 4Fe-4S dicluster domain-containing protein [Chloroflexota bacterium]
MESPETNAKGNNLDLDKIRQRLAAAEAGETWRSLAQLSETEDFKAFLEREFPREISPAGALTRRDFLKLLAAPLAMAGLSACMPQPREQIIPYNDAQAEINPGEPLFFATAMELNGYGRGLLVESRTGRPVKVEGNPNHPLNMGATDPYSQASLLDLYNPQRAQVVSYRGAIRTWEGFLEAISQALDQQRGSQGAGLRVLTGAVTSPTFANQLRSLLGQFPQARWHQYEPVHRDPVYAGAQLAFGEVVETQYRLDSAGVILSLDADFLLREPGSLRYAREFTSPRRQPDQQQSDMNRLYVVESSFTITGASADHRLPVQAGMVEAFARYTAALLGIEVAMGAEPVPAPAGWVEALVADLQDHHGTCAIIAGSRQSPAVHALAHAMNTTLGNVGRTVFYTTPVEANPVGQVQSLQELAQDLEAGLVELMVIFSENPVYTAPADINFAQALENAGLIVYHGFYPDETSLRSDWHIPATHYLEEWSDTRSFDGTATIVQPLIQPLYGGRSKHELMAALLGQPGASGLDVVRGFWQGLVAGAAPETGAGAGGDGTNPTPSAPETAGNEEAAQEEPGAQAEAGFERLWRQALRDGIIPNTAAAQREVTLNPDLAAALGPLEPTSRGFEIVFEPDPSIWDGRFANNAWLQELPKSISQLTWDNAALVSPGSASGLGLSNEELVELRFSGLSVEAPVWIVPGLPDNTVVVHLGYGRTAPGSLSEGLGFNAYALRTAGAQWFGYGVEIHKLNRRYRLANTQDHHALEGRILARSATLEEFQQNPNFAHELEQTGLEGPEGQPEDEVLPQPPSLYPEYDYGDNYAWGMAINLNTCIGCNACVVACQSENNIPVVGKDQVIVGRELHWIRIDTYFQGGLENPQTIFEPVPCMHCEKAPCEPVCPVAATVHSSEGLNEMVYNRCIGTRYCSNNCPYKVRRFNFLQYSEQDLVPLKMVNNPEVTVRSRGVMEKCTYCVQRINNARVEAETEGRPIRDGDVVPACAQACPADAILFGNINDPESQVRQHKESVLNYAMLEELGTQPRTTYLAKVRNPNPAIQEG